MELSDLNKALQKACHNINNI